MGNKKTVTISQERYERLKAQAHSARVAVTLLKPAVAQAKRDKVSFAIYCRMRDAITVLRGDP